MPVAPHVLHASHGALPVAALNELPATQSLRYKLQMVGQR